MKRLPHSSQVQRAAGLIALCWLGSVAAGAAYGEKVVVICPSGTEAFAETMEGIRRQAARPPVELVVLDPGSGTFPADLRRALEQSPRAAVTVGSEAMKLAQQLPPSVPVIRTMVLQSADQKSSAEAGSGRQPGGGVYLDVPVSQILAAVKKAFPAKARVGIILGPAFGSAAADELQTQAIAQGWKASVAHCPSPDELIRLFLSFRGKADFVLTLPDSQLYNSATVKPLVLASIENRLPLIGFSSSFVRAGAAVGVFPDFKSVGAQTAELIQRCITGHECTARETPRVLVTAVNQRVARLIGLQFTESAPDLVVVR